MKRSKLIEIVEEAMDDATDVDSSDFDIAYMIVRRLQEEGQLFVEEDEEDEEFDC